jgi:hypothetical protein
LWKKGALAWTVCRGTVFISEPLAIKKKENSICRESKTWRVKEGTVFVSEPWELKKKENSFHRETIAFTEEQRNSFQKGAFIHLLKKKTVLAESQ